jgi:hypothetical protein
MYSHRTGLTLGFHGCDKSLADEVASGRKDLLASENSYDWLGHGIYFWDHSPKRALEFAQNLKDHPRKGIEIKTPAVIGAVIDLGFCLDLLDCESLELLSGAYELLEESNRNSGYMIPQNKNLEGDHDLLLRNLDCAVIEILPKTNRDNKLSGFDSTRGVFFEGEDLYPNSGFRQKDHIQICVRNPNCIKGYFIPRTVNGKYSRV